MSHGGAILRMSGTYAPTEGCPAHWTRATRKPPYPIPFGEGDQVARPLALVKGVIHEKNHDARVDYPVYVLFNGLDPASP